MNTRGITYAQNKVDRLPYGDNEFDPGYVPCLCVILPVQKCLRKSLGFASQADIYLYVRT